jgi:hypothetical protein
MKRALKYAPPGTPFQVNQRTKRIERTLREHAAELRWCADREDRLAAKIEAARIAGKPIDDGHLMQAWDRGGYCTRYSITKLVGFTPTQLMNDSATRDQLFEMLWGPRITSRSQATRRVKPTPVPQASHPTAPAAPALPDPIAAAVAIVRSARGEDIDWSREPLTERERRIRAVYLEGVSIFKLIALEMHLFSIGKEIASDLRAARDRAQREADEHSDARDRKRLREAAETVDAGEDYGDQAA